MAEYNSIDLSGVRKDIQGLTNSVDNLDNKVRIVANEMSDLKTSMSVMEDDLKAVAEALERMRKDQKREAMLQKAATELVRVRQELQQKYGNNKIIRETMLGVLQATDVALVKKTTISKVSEELMLSTPEYWLAPCLVAVAAWIDNNHDLAERAIKVALDRDEEKTALTMALICRRNNRVQTCYEWLSLYFSKLKAEDFSESSFAYIDAYINGVFGPDEKHMCDDYFAKWMDEIKAKSDVFEEKQEDEWKQYCESFVGQEDMPYAELIKNTEEADRITAYVSRINSSGKIVQYFSNISNAPVDQEQLKENIDEKLIALISNYNRDEEPLRKEEAMWLAVKAYDGDAEAAKKYLEAKERAEQKKRLDLVQQMNRTIVAKAEIPSKRKTAVSFLGNYINKGYKNFIEEKKADFPNSITMNFDGYRCSTVDGDNSQQLFAEYTQFMQAARDSELSNVQTAKPKVLLISSIVLAVISLILLFALPVLGVIGLIVAIVLLVQHFSAKKEIAARCEQIMQDYDNRMNNGRQTIAATINQWKEARTLVYDFNNDPVKNIIA